MANSVQILDKISRNLDMLGLTNSRDASSVTVTNGANALTITYVAASIQSPMGGIDNTSSPFLGIGVANPGKIKIKSTGHAADSVIDILDSAIAAQAFFVCSAFGNNIVLENGNADYSVELRGNVDLVGMGM